MYYTYRYRTSLMRNTLSKVPKYDTMIEQLMHLLKQLTRILLHQAQTILYRNAHKGYKTNGQYHEIRNADH